MIRFNDKISDSDCVCVSRYPGASENGGWPCRPIKSSCFVNGHGVDAGTCWELCRDCCSSSLSFFSPTWMNLPLRAGPDCCCSARRPSWNWLSPLRKRYACSSQLFSQFTFCIQCSSYKFMINNNTSRAIGKSYNSVCKCLGLVQIFLILLCYGILWKWNVEYLKSFNCISWALAPLSPLFCLSVYGGV